MSTTPDANRGGTGGPSNVLLLASSVDDSETTACSELLGATDPAQSHVVLTTRLQSPAQRLAAWDDHVGVRPAETTVVDVSTAARSAAATESDDESLWPSATIERVADGDLLELGKTLDAALGTTERDTALCVHSVSDLLQTAERERVFRFLEVLTRCIERTEGVAHYHLNPDVHDRETLETLAVLFDSVVDLRSPTGPDH